MVLRLLVKVCLDPCCSLGHLSSEIADWTSSKRCSIWARQLFILATARVNSSIAFPSSATLGPCDSSLASTGGWVTFCIGVGGATRSFPLPPLPSCHAHLSGATLKCSSSTLQGGSCTRMSCVLDPAIRGSSLGRA